jgi:hypothetical protein
VNGITLMIGAILDKLPKMRRLWTMIEIHSSVTLIIRSLCGFGNIRSLSCPLNSVWSAPMGSLLEIKHIAAWTLTATIPLSHMV